MNKVIPTEATAVRKIPLIPIECYKGKGVVHPYECSFITVDPDRKEVSKLLDNYEYVSDMLVSLSIIEGLSRYDEMNLPLFDTDGLPNPAFDLSTSESNLERLIYAQARMEVGKHDWMFIPTPWKLDNKQLQLFCYPVLWFALQYGASPIQPQKYACCLEVDGEKI